MAEQALEYQSLAHGDFAYQPLNSRPVLYALNGKAV